LVEDFNFGVEIGMSYLLGKLLNEIQRNVDSNGMFNINVVIGDLVKLVEQNPEVALQEIHDRLVINSLSVN
jgi:hypothetical protein